MNKTNAVVLDFDNPLRPCNIQTLVFQAQSVVRLLAANRDLTEVLNAESDTGTMLVFTFMLLRDMLGTVANRLDELDTYYLSRESNQ